MAARVMFEPILRRKYRVVYDVTIDYVNAVPKLDDVKEYLNLTFVDDSRYTVSVIETECRSIAPQD